MPPAGFVGIKLTPQRKLMLNEVMETESLNKPSDAIDLVLALAADYVKPAESELTELPSFLNYFVGEAAPEELTPTGTQSPLVAAERRNKMVSNLTWRRDALAFVKNVEPTIVNLADAIDFALSAYIMAQRSGHLSEQRIAEVREQVKRNAVAFREEVAEYLEDNMREQEREARLAGKKTVKSSKTIRMNYNAARESAITELVAINREYRRAVAANETDLATSILARIADLEQRLVDIDLAERRDDLKEMVAKVAKREASVAVRTDAEGNKSVLPF